MDAPANIMVGNELQTRHETRPAAVSGLSSLGKRIEMLRIERGIPKQLLARRAGSSRQQLWRVMTGKSELTSALGARLARALDVEVGTLTSESSSPRSTSVGAQTAATLTLAAPRPARAPSLSEYVGDSSLVEQTLRTLPGGSDGTRLKRALLNELEAVASAAGARLTPRFIALRRRVLNGEL